VDASTAAATAVEEDIIDVIEVDCSWRLFLELKCVTAEKVHATTRKNVLWRVFLSCAESSFRKRKGGLDLAKYGLDLAGP
jgi:hypothetical protein